MEELLRIQDLHLSFDTPAGELQAVRGVSLSLFRGETLALAGESGCGKSVTAKSILQLNPASSIRAHSGAIYVNGENITVASEKEMNRIRGNVAGMIFQDPMSSLNPSMRIGKQIADGLKKHRGLSSVQCKKEAVRLLEMVRIPDAEVRARQFPHQLSGGMRQRVMIAMAIACEPQILIADEPTTALDVTIQAEILGMLSDLKEHLDMATLFITHDLAVAASLADRIAIMYAGKIVETGPVSTVFSAPAHPYTKALLDSHPSGHSASEEDLPFIPGILPNLTKPIAGCAFAPRCSSSMDICLQKEPAESSVSEEHQVSCLLYGAGQTGGKNK